MQIERMSFSRKLGYSLGNPGFQLTDRIVIGVALYFYLPPEGRGLVPQVSEHVFWAVLTVFGVAMLIGRVFDALADPLVGYASDRSSSRWGRRRSFLILGLVPMVVLPVLLFWPPAQPGAFLNGVALAMLLSLYFIAFTVYVGPYLALIPEIATTQGERTRLATLLAWASILIIGLYSSLWLFGLDSLAGQGLAAPDAIRVVVLVSSVLAFLLCLFPILAVDERRFVRHVPTTLRFREALTQTLANRPYLIHLAGLSFLILASSVIQPVLPYYATVIAGRTEGFGGWLNGALFAGILVGLLVLPRLIDRLGAKRSMVLCCSVLSIVLIPLVLLRPDIPGGPHDTQNLIILWSVLALAGLPGAGLLILPYVLIGQLIDYDQTKTGSSRSAMYFGVQGFALKWVYGLAAALISFLFLRFGKSTAEPLGLLLIGPLASLFCMLAAGLYMLYPEPEVLGAARESNIEQSRPS